MDAAESQIWNDHQKRLSEISREIKALEKDFILKDGALKASLKDQPEILKKEIKKVSTQYQEKITELKKRETAEIGRYMGKIKEYDESKSKNLGSQQPLSIEEQRKKFREQLEKDLQQKRGREKDRER
jgi:tRNA nucleotidyltransferase/poly(A) polymerase